MRYNPWLLMVISKCRSEVIFVCFLLPPPTLWAFLNSQRFFTFGVYDFLINEKERERQRRKWIGQLRKAAGKLGCAQDERPFTPLK